MTSSKRPAISVRTVFSIVAAQKNCQQIADNENPEFAVAKAPHRDNRPNSIQQVNFGCFPCSIGLTGKAALRIVRVVPVKGVLRDDHRMKARKWRSIRVLNFRGRKQDRTTRFERELIGNYYFQTTKSLQTEGIPMTITARNQSTNSMSA